jgi:hypothetical protein
MIAMNVFQERARIMYVLRLKATEGQNKNRPTKHWKEKV